MNRAATAVLLAWLLMLPLLTAPTPAYAAGPSAPSARQKPGPITLRGILSNFHATGFTLSTTTHGTFSVVVASATSVTEKGKTGRIRLGNGDHVGVRGFLSGREIRAIRIRVYPVKPKPFSIRGVVAGVQGNEVTVAVAGGKRVRVQVGSGTLIDIGSGPGKLSQVKTGEKVLVRMEPLGGVATAIRLHVYVHKVAGLHVRVQGALVSVSGNRVMVRANGSTQQVQLTAQTVIRRGIDIVGRNDLKPGQTVTVYACCAGQKTVAATSIHILKTKVTSHAVLLSGRVVSVGPASVRLAVATGTVTVALSSSTTFSIGAATASRTGIRAGDEVSVRAYLIRGGYQASKVHVLASSLRPHSVDGVVVSIRGNQITVRRTTGRRAVLIVGAHTSVSLSGATIRISAIHVGDKVRASGTVSGNAIAAITVRLTRTKLKSQVVRGTVASIHGSVWVIVYTLGAHHTIRLSHGVKPSLGGKAAGAAAIFPGVHAVARGYPVRGAIAASSLTLTVKSRVVKGRATRIERASVVVRASVSRTVTVDVPAGATVSDGRARLHVANLHAGVELVARGYVETASRMRATSIALQHPQVNVSAVVVSIVPFIVQTSAGVKYRLRAGNVKPSISSRTPLRLTLSDIPTGARVHILGTLDSQGEVDLQSIVVRLPSVTVRGTVTPSRTGVWILASSGTTVRVRLQAAIPIVQGSHVLVAGDVVPGDDVTVYGYTLDNGVILARKIDVHRKLVGLDGTVTVVTANGFTLSTVAGDHAVLVSASTIQSGLAGPVSVGDSLHVTGYLRGDGSVLATRIRAGKKHKAVAKPTPV